MATKSTDLAPFVRQRQKSNLDEIDAYYVGRREKKVNFAPDRRKRRVGCCFRRGFSILVTSNMIYKPLYGMAARPYSVQRKCKTWECFHTGNIMFWKGLFRRAFVLLLIISSNNKFGRVWSVLSVSSFWRKSPWKMTSPAWVISFSNANDPHRTLCFSRFDLCPVNGTVNLTEKYHRKYRTDKLLQLDRVLCKLS